MIYVDTSVVLAELLSFDRRQIFVAEALGIPLEAHGA